MTYTLRYGLHVLLCGLILSCGSNTKSQTPAPAPPWETSPTTQPAPPNLSAPVPPIDQTVPYTPAPSASVGAVPMLGTAETLEIGTWNIENYPKTAGSKDMVSKILNRLNVDIMAVEEITSGMAFQELLALMPGYTGILANSNDYDPYSQIVGFIYRQADFTLVRSDVLFEGESFAFPRPALMIRLHPVESGRADIVAIAVHLKAFGDEKSQQRREMANVQLQQFALDLQLKEPNLQIVILGDFNQPLLETEARKVFGPWLDRKDRFTVQTDVLAQNGGFSYVSSFRQSLVDHIISSNSFDLTVPVIPMLQTLVPNYEADASDHLPVITRLR